jgi:iron complex transport system ATP-binding protein
MNKLEVTGLSYSYLDKRVIENINIKIESGAFVGIIGPNGSGKSTILKNIYGGLTPDEGEIFLDGQNKKKIKKRAFAAKVAVVGQENSIPFNFTVKEIVAMGRTPYKKIFEPDTAEDKEIVLDALEKVKIADMAERDFSCLSGGEKQRVLIARALAQKTSFMILDEPTNHLDICFQLQIFEILKSLGITVLAAIHDLNLAAMYCDYAYVLSGRTICRQGITDEVLSADLIEHIFNVKCDVSISPATGKKNIVYIPTHK